MTAHWTPRSAWHGITAPGRIGRPDGAPGVRLEPVEHLAMATVIGRAGGDPALDAALAELFGAPPPRTPRLIAGAAGSLLWSGPDQWLATGAGLDVAHLAGRLAGLAAVADQSDARAVVRVSGPQARAALAKGCMIDLHPRAFRPGDVALTAIAHIGVQLWQADEAPTYGLAVFRSMAGSFWSWLTGSAAEFGCEVVRPIRG